MQPLAAQDAPAYQPVGWALGAAPATVDTLLEKNLLAVGDPEEIVRVVRLYEAAGMSHFPAINNFGGMEHGCVLRSMKRIAKHVLPAFREQLHDDSFARNAAKTSSVFIRGFISVSTGFRTPAPHPRGTR